MKEQGTLRVKELRDDATLDSVQHSQADWIRQYMERQEEVCFKFVCFKSEDFRKTKLHHVCLTMPTEVSLPNLVMNLILSMGNRL